MLWDLPWWRHQMEAFSALLALCERNPPVPGGSPSQRPVTQSFDVLFDVRLNKRLCKQSRRRWFETPSRSLWRHCNALYDLCIHHTCTFVIVMVYVLFNHTGLFFITMTSHEPYCVENNRRLGSIISYPPSAAYMRQWTRSALVQIMAFRRQAII